MTLGSKLALALRGCVVMSGTEAGLPVRFGGTSPSQLLTPIAVWRHARAVQQHLRHTLYRFEVELIDLEAASQIALAQMIAEMDLYLAGMTRAGGDEVLQLLVMRKLAYFSEANGLRLAWFQS